MSDSLYTWLGLCGFLAFVFGMAAVAAVAVFFIIRGGRRRTAALQEAWEAFAQLNGLTFEPGSLLVHPRVTGVYRQRPVTLSIFTIPRGRGVSLHYTVAATPVQTSPEAQAQAADRMQTGFFYRTLEGPVIPVGDGQFLAKFEVKGNSAAVAQAALTPAVQAALLQSGISHLTVDKGQLSVRRRGFESRPEALGGLLDLVCQAAAAVE